MEAFSQILMFFGQVYFGLLFPDEDSQRSELLHTSFHSLKVSKGISSIQIFFIGYEYSHPIIDGGRTLVAYSW